jgi:hypothetical protein
VGIKEAKIREDFKGREQDPRTELSAESTFLLQLHL